MYTVQMGLGSVDVVVTVVTDDSGGWGVNSSYDYRLTVTHDMNGVLCTVKIRCLDSCFMRT